MAWMAPRRRRGRVEGAGAVEALAQEIRAALMPRPRGTASGQRRPEWGCLTCGVTNWADRPACRRCGGARPAGRASPAGNTQPPLPHVTPRPPRPWGQSPTLGAVAHAAEAAGASAQSIAALRHDAEARREERRTPGGRLDAARARAARTARQAEEATAAAQAATAKAEEAAQAAAAAAAELVAVEAELAAQPRPTPEPAATFIADVRALLEELERAPIQRTVGNGPALPEGALAAIAALRRRVDAPPPVAILGEALEPEERAPEAGGGDEGASTTDEVMDELAEADEDNDEALAAIARRLKRARRERTAPY